MTIDLSTLCKWGPEKEVATRSGMRMLRTAEPSQRFWDEWRKDKESLKGQGISVSKELFSWEVSWWRTVTDDAKVVADTRATSMSYNANVNIDLPDGLSLLPYQLEGVKFALGCRDTLIADEMGMGKCIEAIAFCNAVRPSSVLIVCPASLKINWHREWTKWSTLNLSVAVESSTSWDASADIHILNWDILKTPAIIKHVTGRIWDAVIADEAHYAKNPKAARTKAFFSISALRRLFLTGTPVLNRPIELYPMLNAMKLPFALSWEKYVRRYCDATRTQWGWDVSGASNTAELSVKLRDSVMIRRLKRDVLQDLPEKTTQMVSLPLNGATKEVAAEVKAFRDYEARMSNAREVKRRLIKSGQTDSEEYKEAVNSLKAFSAEFALIAKLRHQTALKKVPYVVDTVAETVDSADACVVFAHHTDVIKSIVDGLKEKGLKAEAIIGDTPLDERQTIVDAFQGGSIQVVVGSIRACGTGLTLTRASNVIFAELDWSPSVIDQAADRCHRIGQKDAVLIKHLVFDGTVDAMLAKAVVDKTEIIDSVMGDEGE